jgi:hypothetical protein
LHRTRGLLLAQVAQLQSFIWLLTAVSLRCGARVATLRIPHHRRCSRLYLPSRWHHCSHCVHTSKYMRGRWWQALLCYGEVGGLAALQMRRCVYLVNVVAALGRRGYTRGYTLYHGGIVPLTMCTSMWLVDGVRVTLINCALVARYQYACGAAPASANITWGQVASRGHCNCHHVPNEI